MASRYGVHLTVDTREPIELFTNVSALLDGVKRGTLHAADFAWVKADGSKRGIERKTLSDLLGSLRSGRLEEELAKCLETYQQVDLLIEDAIGEVGGIVIPMKARGVAWYPGISYIDMTPGQFANLQSSICEHGIGIVTSPSLSCTPSVIVDLYKRDQKKESDHKFLRGKVGRPKAAVYTINPKVSAIMGVCPGIPEKVAGEIIARHGSLYKFLLTYKAKRDSIPGFGQGLYTKILTNTGYYDDAV